MSANALASRLNARLVLAGTAGGGGGSGSGGSGASEGSVGGGAAPSPRTSLASLPEITARKAAAAAAAAAGAASTVGLLSPGAEHDEEDDEDEEDGGETTLIAVRATTFGSSLVPSSQGPVVTGPSPSSSANRNNRGSGSMGAGRFFQPLQRGGSAGSGLTLVGSGPGSGTNSPNSPGNAAEAVAINCKGFTVRLRGIA